MNQLYLVSKLTFKQRRYTAMAKLYTHVGAAVYKGKDKFRFTNGRADVRIKTMTKEGFERIEFIELGSEMTKEQALQTAQAAELAARRGLTIPSVDAPPEAPEQEAA
jgi:hypothetical protein